MRNQRFDVCIVTPGTFPIPSTTGSSVETVVYQIGKLLKDQIRLCVLGPKTTRQPGYETREGIAYVRVRYRNSRNYIQTVGNRIKSLKPCIIQIENRPRFAERIKKKYPYAQVWISLHSTTFISKPHISPRNAERCLDYADRIIVNSQYLKNAVSDLMPRLRNRIVINHLGADPAVFAPRWEEAQRQRKEKFAIETGLVNKKVILFIGRLIRKKGIHHLLEIMPELIQRHPDAVLVVVGGARYGSNRLTPYVRMLHRLGSRLPQHIRFVPYVPYDKIYQWFLLGDMLVVPSDEKEAFGLVNVEAMATGLPVVATNGGGIKEVIEHGVTGYLVDPYNLRRELLERIGELMEDPDLRRRMGERGVERVRRHFTWEHTASRLAGMYRDTLSAKNQA